MVFRKASWILECPCFACSAWWLVWSPISENHNKFFCSSSTTIQVILTNTSKSFMSACPSAFEWFAFEFISNVFCIRAMRAVDFSCFERKDLKKFAKVTWGQNLFKAFLKGSEGKNYKTRLDLTSHNLKTFFRPRDGHIAQNLLVLSHLGSILLKSNSSFVASFQHLKIKWVIICYS